MPMILLGNNFYDFGIAVTQVPIHSTTNNRINLKHIIPNPFHHNLNTLGIIIIDFVDEVWWNRKIVDFNISRNLITVNYNNFCLFLINRNFICQPTISGIVPCFPQLGLLK